MSSPDTVAIIRDSIARIASIAPPEPDADIYLAGFASTDALELLVELEDRFGIQVPDDRFIEARSIAALAALVVSLVPESTA